MNREIKRHFLHTLHFLKDFSSLIPFVKIEYCDNKNGNSFPVKSSDVSLEAFREVAVKIEKINYQGKKEYTKQ